MFVNNQIIFGFEEGVTAEKALDILRTAFRTNTFKPEVGAKIADALEIEKDTCINANLCVLAVNDSLEYFNELLPNAYKALSDNDVDLPITNIANMDGYENSYIDAFIIDDSYLHIHTEYYPYDYNDALFCDECGATVTTREEYDQLISEYSCPECGAVVSVNGAFDVMPVFTDKDYEL